MNSTPSNQYVEVRNGSYYVAGTRVGLDVLVYEFRRGQTADAIFDSYPSIGSLAKVYGALAYILEYPNKVEAYLQEQDRHYNQFKAANPLPTDMIDRFERGKSELSARQS